MSDRNIDKIKSILEENSVPDRISPQSIKEMLDNQNNFKKPKISVKRNIVKILPVAASVVLVAGIGARLYSNSIIKNEEDSLIEMSEEETDGILTVNNLKKAESYKQIYDYMNIDEWPITWYGEEVADAVDGGGEVGFVVEESTSAAGAEADEYIKTYNQESGVNEADIVKTDGKKIFYCSSNQVNAVEVNNGDFSNGKAFADDVGIIEQMYLYDESIIIISHDWDSDNTIVSIYSKDTYELTGRFSQKGDFNDVRLMDNGFMYLISEYQIYCYNGEIDEEEIEDYIPSYKQDGEKSYLNHDDIYMSTCEIKDNATYMYISSFDLSGNQPCKPVDLKAVVGDAGIIYCSAENLYVTYGYENTEITRFALDAGKIIPSAGTKVKGYVNDQFSMSEYNGYFRIATSYEDGGFFGFGEGKDNNALYVLDMNLETVGKLTNFGIEEKIYSVKFEENTAYIVTFRQTDPLYSIDISNPEKPVIKDALKITGYSSYMQKWQDGMLLGFGRSGDENGGLTGLKLSMFDNSNIDELEVIDSTEVNSGEYENITSQALYDRKALLISPEKNIIGVPAILESFGLKEDYTMTSAYLFYSFENDEFVPIGKIDITENYFYSDFDRAVIIGDCVYVLSEHIFISADIKSFERIDRYRFDN